MGTTAPSLKQANIHVPNNQPFTSCLLPFQRILPKAACLPTFTTSTTTTPVSNSCTCSGLQPGHWADQRWRLWCQQGPLLPQGGEGYLQEQVRALQREDLLHPKRGDLQARYVQELHRGHRDQH